MDKAQILQILEDNYSTSNPLEIPESERWHLYQHIKSKIQTNGDADEYTRQIILIAEVLKL